MLERRLHLILVKSLLKRYLLEVISQIFNVIKLVFRARVVKAVHTAQVLHFGALQLLNPRARAHDQTGKSPVFQSVISGMNKWAFHWFYNDVQT